MKQAMFAQQKQRVKTDPRIKMFSWLLILYWILAAFEWFLAITRVLTGVGPINAQGQFSFGSSFNTFGPPILWTGLTIIYVFVVRSWKRFDQRRQAAAQGDPRLLATDQPVPNAQALSLPLTIRMRIKRSWLIALPISLLCMFLPPFLAGLIAGLQAHTTRITYPQPISLGPLLIILGVVLLIPILFAGVMLSVMYVKGREQITLTEYGILLAGVMPKTRSISWSEARLFSIINSYEFKRLKNRQPLMFELANEHETVRWTWLHRASIRWGVVQPVLPPAEYEQQMRNVLSVIAAKTGLPLYDLRKKQDSHNQQGKNREDLGY